MSLTNITKSNFFGISFKNVFDVMWDFLDASLHFKRESYF